MYNPSSTTEFWDSTGPQDIQLGTNTMSWGENGFSANVHLQFVVQVDSDDAVILDSYAVIVTDSGGTSNNSDYNDYYVPSNVTYYGDEDFTFGQNSLTGEAISWKQK